MRRSQVAVHRRAAAVGARLRHLLSVYRQATIVGRLAIDPANSCFHCNVRRATMGGLPVAGGVFQLIEECQRADRAWKSGGTSYSPMCRRFEVTGNRIRVLTR